MIQILIVICGLISSTIGSNLCDFKKCKSNEVACYEIVPKFQTILCKCARYCKRVKLEELDISGQISSVIDVLDEDEVPNLTNTTQQLAYVKRGGSACTPFSCLNGGLCYTSFSKIAKRDCSIPLSASKECLLLDSNQPLCSCQSGFSGEKCQLQFEPTNMCDIPKLCNNGAKCLTIAENQFQCICPSYFAGKYCEQIIYMPCPDRNNHVEEGAPLCHPENGFCSPEGKCVCKTGFTGESCSQVNTNLKKFDPKTCSLKNCNGHGICVDSNTTKQFNCLCDMFYTGEQCDTYFNININSTSTTEKPSPTLIKSKRKLRNNNNINNNNKTKRVKNKMLMLTPTTNKS